MSTDRELLELAAKAAGLTIAWDARGAYIVAEGVSGAGDVWNPLTDDGDALRLAVKLGMEVACDDESAHLAFAYARVRGCGDDYIFEPVVDDPCRATRRAIVRAAAAIAKAQP